jgi:hypothetical protein
MVAGIAFPLYPCVIEYYVLMGENTCGGVLVIHLVQAVGQGLSNSVASFFI